MDIFSAIVVVVPLIAPAAIAMHVDPYHLGVIFLLNLEVGYLHPPVGLNLFITSFTFRKPILEVTIAALPFLGIMIAALGVITYIPQLTIPKPAERRGRVSEIRRMVHEAYQAASSVSEVPLPDGGTMKMSDCDKLADEAGKINCKGLFIDVTACRAKAGGQVGSDCEKKAIEDYIKSTKSDEDWNEDDDSGGGKAGDKGKPAEAAPGGDKGAAPAGGDKDKKKADDDDDWSQ
jgi:hypothetical protein